MNYEKQKLTWIKSEEKTSKAGKKFTSVSIKTDRYGDRFLSGFGSKENRDWKVGDEVELIVTEKEYNGKSYLNFEHKREPRLEDRVAILEDTVNKIREFLKPIYEERKKAEDKSSGKPHYPTPEEEGIDFSDIRL